MGKIRVAMIGVGNCASSLIQGIEYYKNNKDTDFVPGVMHVNLGGYHIRDTEFVAAFDIDKNKVGKDLSEAIFTPPNNTTKFSKVPNLKVKVERGMTHDGLGKYLSQIIQKAPGSTADVVGILKEAKTDVVINFLPVGSEEATKWYMEQILEAGCAFINCIPVFIVSDSEWQEKYRKAGLPMAGDDIKSQVGATILHRVIAQLLSDRGVEIDETYQLNIGGNTDFENMTAENRLASKRISKTEAVTSILDYPVPTRIGPSDYVPFLDDTKVCYIHAQGKKWGGMPIHIALKLSVEDSPNSAGVVADVIRATKIALDRGTSGPLKSISSYSFKHPPEQIEDSIAKQRVEEFIQGNRER